MDLQALDCYGRATSSEVYNALKWCYRNNIQVINMSLGTIYIKDIQRLYPIIRKLIQKGCVIVAAYSNEGLQSYPACAKDVIGVRQDWLNLLKPYEYCLKENQNIIVRVEEELTIYGKQLKTVHSNSFATAFMTAFIAEKMDKKHLKNRGEVWRELEKDAKNDVNYFYNLLGCEYL